jgi:hypothetical protein
MKAYCVGLEVEINLSEQEVLLLKTKVLEGMLTFRDIHSEATRQIPLKLFYAPGKKESLTVEQIPADDYFGRAKSIHLNLEDYFYSCLVEQGWCGDRFFGAEGKVIIRAKN